MRDNQENSINRPLKTKVGGAKTLTMSLMVMLFLTMSSHAVNLNQFDNNADSGFLDLFRRTDRVLQSGSFGSYNIEYPSSDLTCDESRTAMDYSQRDLNARHPYSSRMFSFGRETSLDWLKKPTEDNKDSMKTVVFWVVIPVVLVGIVLGVLIGLLAIADIVLRIIGKEGVLFKGGDGDGIKTDSLRRTVFMTLGCLTVTILVLMFFWLTYSVRSKSSYNMALCSNKYLEEDLIYGTNTKDMSFPGARGYRILFGNLKEELKLIDNVSSVEDIISQNLDAQTETLKTTLTTFFSTFGARTVMSCSGSDKLIRPDSTRNIEPYINDDIDFESNRIMQIANDIHTGANTINYLQNRGCLKKYTLSLDMMLGKMSEYERAIESSKDNLEVIADYPESTTKMIWFAWLSFILMLIGLSFVMFILFTNVIQGNNRSVARICQGIGAILLFIFGVWFSVLAVRAAYRAHRQN
jgi:protein-S-isoprenylcysteine O-methyltransferase Ste14